MKRSFVFRNLLSLLALSVLLVSCRSTPVPNSLHTHNSARWEKDILAFEISDQTNPPPVRPIVFTGSSSIRLWKSLADDFPGKPVLNRGFGGSQLADAWFYADRIVNRYHPRQVIIYSGGNDLNAGKSPERVFGDFVALTKRLRQATPDVRIGYIAVAPNPARWAQIENVRQLNRKVEAYCRRHGMDFIDVAPAMLASDGLPKSEIFVADRLHMNSEGYRIWKGVVGPYLQ